MTWKPVRLTRSWPAGGDEVAREGRLQRAVAGGERGEDLAGTGEDPVVDLGRDAFAERACC